MRPLISICLLGCALLVHLGLWQLKRGDEKEDHELIRSAKGRSNAVNRERTLGPTESTIWTNYQLSGRFLNKVYLQITSMKNSSVGYDVISF